jgi:hypothetical protein
MQLKCVICVEKVMCTPEDGGIERSENSDPSTIECPLNPQPPIDCGGHQASTSALLQCKCQVSAVARGASTSALVAIGMLTTSAGAPATSTCAIACILELY